MNSGVNLRNWNRLINLCPPKKTYFYFLVWSGKQLRLKNKFILFFIPFFFTERGLPELKKTFLHPYYFYGID